MRKLLLAILLTSSCFPMSQAQQVRLAKVGLGMTEAELKQVLDGASPHYTDRTSSFAGKRSMLAVTEEESYLFTFANDKVVAFSLVHLLPAGQQPFLPAGQEPTLKALRDLVIMQTWTPASVNAGDTFWLSDAHGAPLSTLGTCAPTVSAAWKPSVAQKSGETPSTVGLMEPVVTN
jgi:hypothetical protein